MRNVFSFHTQMFIVAVFWILHLSLEFHLAEFHTVFCVDTGHSARFIEEELSLKHPFFCVFCAQTRNSAQTRLVAHFSQQIWRNALYQYTFCTIPQNKCPANAKLAEFRNNQNLRLETLCQMQN